jgi:HEPN domain-containing protein
VPASRSHERDREARTLNPRAERNRTCRRGALVDEEEFERWHGAAQEALAAARVQTETGAHHWACFLAEQAAQLSLKGLLHGVGEAPWGHDLVELAAAASSSLGRAWPGELDPVLTTLSQYYIPTRYPDANPSGRPSLHYGERDASAAVASAEHVLESIASAWAMLRRQA